MTRFTDFLNQNETVLFPGGTGTELQRRGFKTTLPLWSASAVFDDGYDLLVNIHKDYFDAGADICITNTFRTTPRAFKKVGREDEARDASRRAVQAAKDARASITNRPTFIGGSIATLEDCYEPDLVPDDATLAREHGQLATWLAEDGVDFIMPETINTVREAKAMAKASSDTGLPFIISFLADSDGNMMDGTTLQQAIDETDLPGRAAISINCRPIDTLDKAFDILRAATDLPLCIYPNGIGHPHEDEGWIFENNPDSIDRFVNAALSWKDRGAKILGGCCGTTPDYIAALTKAVRYQNAA